MQTSDTRRIPTIICFNVLCLGASYFLTPLSHVTQMPLYLLEPARWFCLLALASTGWINAFFVAWSLPFFSHALTHHPSLIKTALITIELNANLAILFFLRSYFKKAKRDFTGRFNCFFVSSALSKIIYYGLKSYCLQRAFLQGPLITTPWSVQIPNALLMGWFFARSSKNSG